MAAVSHKIGIENSIVWLCTKVREHSGCEMMYEDETVRGAAKRVREQHWAKHPECRQSKILITSLPLLGEQRLPRPAKGRASVKLYDWGIVYIAEGRFAGRLGYYDDDADRRRCLVYIGTPMFSKSIYVRLGGLREATAFEKSAFEKVYMSKAAYAEAQRALDTRKGAR